MLRSRLVLPLVTLLLTVGGCDDKKGDDAKSPPAKADRKADDGKAEVASGRVWFVSPADGATVPRKFDVEFGVEGKKLEPAGGTTRDPAVGHHHIIIDGGPIPDMEVVPKDEKHLHYGDGSSKTTLMLEPGEHTLTMQFADGAHQSYGPAWAATIKVTVEDDAAADGADAAADGGDAAAEGDAKADGADAAADGDAKADDSGGA